MIDAQPNNQDHYETAPADASSGKILPITNRYPWIACAVLGGVFLAILFYALIATFWHSLIETEFPGSTAPLWTGRSLDQVGLHILEGLTILWLFFLGGSFGSFLNVVVYRWPRRLTLWGSSRCPSCGHPIRLRHNIPVLAWLFLSGRCYDCRAPISARYPLVEALVGTYFVILAAAEWFSGGSSLPWRPINIYRGIAWAVFDPQWDLILIFTTHAALLWILLAWALMELDGSRVPLPFVVVAYAAALLVALFLPFVQPVPWWGGFVARRDVGGGVVTALAGIIAGGMIGGALWALADQRPSWPAARFVGLAGAVLGWQSVISIALWSTLADFLAKRAVRWRTRKQASKQLPVTGEPSSLTVQLAAVPPAPTSRPKEGCWKRYRGFWLWTGVLVHLLTWRMQSNNQLWPGPDAGLATVLVAAVIALSASSASIWLDRRAPHGSLSLTS